MSGTLNANFVQSDLGTDLILNPTTTGGNNVTIGTGSLNFATTNQKILGDFTNATVASRTNFQTSTANSSTGIYALPSGTSTAASWQATNAADPTNASKVLIATNGSTDVQLVSGRNGTGTYLPLSFYTNGQQQMQLNTSGTLILQGGASSTGVGIAFPANQVQSSDANTLDDYEEGTWTPTDASGAGLTLTVNSAQYVKIGQSVFIYVFVSYPSNSSGAQAKIGGLPFLGINTSSQNYQLTGRNQSGTAYNGQITGNSSVIDPVPMTSFNAGPANSAFSSSGVIFSGFYKTNT